MKRALTISLIALLCLQHGAFCQNQHRALIVPVEFSDLSFSTSTLVIDSLANALSKYYESQFPDSTKFIFDVNPVVSVSNGYAYFGANTSDRRDALAHRMAVGIYRNLCSKMDMSVYDNNSDGSLNHIIFLTAGQAESYGGGDDQFWPQYIELKENEIPHNLRPKLTAFAIASELNAEGKTCGIGMLAHEFGHVLGLKDMYDTDADASGGFCPGLGPTCLMDRGLDNDGANTPPNLNAIEREMLGAGSCELLDSSRVFSLEPIHLHGRYCKLPSSSDGQYWLLENRKAEGNDAFIGGEGMLIYKVDKSDSPAGYSTYYQRTLSALERWNLNQINCNPEYPCAQIVPAVSDTVLTPETFWPQPGKTTFSPGSKLAITDISREAGGNISFKVLEPIHIDGVSVFQSSAIVAWSVSEELGPVDSCKIEWYNQGKLAGSSAGQSTGLGCYSCTLGNLSPRTSYSYTAYVYYADGSSFSTDGSFTTRIYRSGIFRFIYLPEDGRNADGSFKPGTAIPLVVYNSVGEEVEWSFNGRQISAGADGLWTIPDSGTLKAEVSTAKGSKETIIKEIVLK